MKQEARRYVVKKLSVMLMLMGSVSMVFAFILPRILPVLAAAPPNIINYQGRILNANSVPVSNTAVDMEFRLYTELAGGVCVWSNSSGTCDGDTPASTSPISIPLIAGLFSVRLGDTGDGFAAIADSVFADNEGIYLEIEINGEVLAPRKRIVSAAYAINSKTLEGISADGFLKSDGDTATGNYDLTGVVILGGAPLVFEGATEDAHKVSFVVTDPTDTRTITFKDESGTVAYLSDIPVASSLWDDGTNGTFEDDAAVIIGADAAFTYVNGGVGDLRVANELEVMTNAFIHNNLIVGASTSSTETLTNAGFSLGGDDLFVAGDAGVKGALYTDGGLIIGATTTFTDGSIVSSGAMTLETTTGDLTFVSGSGNVIFGTDNNLIPTLGAGNADIGASGTRWDNIFAVAGDYSGTVTAEDLMPASGTSSLGSSLDRWSFISAVDAEFSEAVIAELVTVEFLPGSPFASIGLVGNRWNEMFGITGNFSSSITTNQLLPSLGTSTIGQSGDRWNDIFGVTGNFSGTITVADLSCNNCLDFTEFADAMTLDASTSITSAGANSLSFVNSGSADTVFNMTGTGDIVVQSGGSSFWTFHDNKSVLLNTDTTGTAFRVMANSVTNDFAALIEASGLTTGRGLAVHMGGNGAFSSGQIVMIEQAGTRTTSGTVSGNMLLLDKSETHDSGGALTYSGALAKIRNAPANTSGTLTDQASLLHLDQQNAAHVGDALLIENAGTGNALAIYAGNVSNAKAALYVSADASGTGNAIKVDYDGSSGRAVDINANNLENGSGLRVISTSNQTHSSRLVNISHQASFSSATSIPATNSLNVLRSFTSTSGNVSVGPLAPVAQITNTGFESGGTITDTSNVLEIRQAFSGATGNVLNLWNEGAGTGLYIQNGSPGGSVGKSAQAIYIDSDQTGTSRILTIETNDSSSNNIVFNIHANGDFQYDGTGSSPAADLAETYPSNDVLVPGELVSVDPSNNEYVKRTSVSYEAKLFGAVSTKPAIRMGSAVEGYDIALTGRIPLKVSAENGSISIGDPLTSSATPGHAMKATEPGMIVGFALEAHAGGTGEISAFINTGWYAGNLIEAHSTGALVKSDLLFSAIGAATTDVQGAASRALSFRGSGWDGTQAVNKEMKLLVEVKNSDHYRLSMKDTDGSEVAFVNNEGDFALTGKLYPSDRGQMQTEKYIYYDGSGGGGGDFMRTNASGWGTGSYDFAEMFPAKEVLEPGTVVVFGASKEHVARSTGKKYDAQIAGIISTRPGFLAGDNLPGHVPVALAGRVPTKVSNENGAIKVGDPLTTSSTPGVAMKATEPGQIIGFAMEPFNGTMGTIIVFVRASYHNGSSSPQFADNSASGLVTGATLSMDGDMNLNGGNIFSVRSVTGIGGWRIAETGDFITKGRFIHRITSRQNESVETYAALGRESTIQLTGTVELKNGTAEVKFKDIDAKFSGIISVDHPYRVFMTPTGSTGQLYVSEKDGDGFKIQETAGSSTILVDWMVVAYHKDFAPTQNQGSVPQVEVSTEDEVLLDGPEDEQGSEVAEVEEEQIEVEQVEVEEVDAADVDLESLDDEEESIQVEGLKEGAVESENEN